MKRILYILCALALLCTSCEKDDIKVTNITRTTVHAKTSTADVTIYIANQNGSSSYATVQSYGVFIAQGRTPTTKDEKISFTNTSGNSVNNYSFTLTGLQANTNYNILPFIANDLSMVTGDVVAFATDGSATVTTKAATNISSSSATLNGSVSVDGYNVTISKRGFLLSNYTSNPTIGDSGVDQWETTGKTGDYGVTYTGLQSNSRYYFRAYAIVNNETLYGSVRNFTTLSEGGGGGGTTTLGSKVSDFIGTYSAKAYSVDDQEYYTWDGVVISTFNNTNTNTEWIEVSGLNGGRAHAYALGEFDATQKAIRLYSEWAFTDETYKLKNYGDTLFISQFFPVYVEKNDPTFANSHILRSGNGFEGTGEAFLTFNDEGKLVFGPASTPDSQGYYANGYDFACVYSDNWDHILGWYEAFIEVTLTKTSSSASAPAKIQHVNSLKWHAPMNLPEKRNTNTVFHRNKIK